MKTITVTWADGRLEGRGDDDTLYVVNWPEPINAGSDSWAIAEAITYIDGSRIIAVDHDREYVHITVEKD